MRSAGLYCTSTQAGDGAEDAGSKSSGRSKMSACERQAEICPAAAWVRIVGRLAVRAPTGGRASGGWRGEKSGGERG